MGSLSDGVLDAALQYIEDGVENLYITSAEATTYAEAQSTYKLGTKESPGITGPGAGDVSGRKTTVDAITDGVVDATDDATHWALTDNSESELLAAGALSSSESVTQGNVFTLTEFDIEIPDPS
jgi:hypothetical protein